MLVAMSGGVDSSVAAFLLQEQGYDCTGAMMKLFEAPEGMAAEKGCCTLEDAEDARNVAQKLDIPFYVFNFTDAFEKEVMQRFIKAYKNGTTPNPCIDCNRYVKFEKFLHRAAETEHDYIATGHYAQIEQDTNGRFLLKKGPDETKDQSYVLYAMTQKQLSRTLLPLGGMDKRTVRKIAEKAGLINAKKRDSQDICFAPDGDYARVIGETPPGDFISPDGKILGKHKGIAHYTIGQRKGLGISAPHPLYVSAVNAAENTITLSSNEQLFSPTLTAGDVNLIPFDTFPDSLRLTVKIRYAHAPQPATVYAAENNQLRLHFDKPQRAITPGQAVVLYDGDYVIGGGTIL